MLSELRSTDLTSPGAARKLGGAAAPVLSVIVPTFDEAANISTLIARLKQTLKDVAFEVIVVDDDSPDGTAEIVRTMAQRDPSIRCIQRLGRRGLASACVEGMMASSARYLAVIDADLQHDETLLPRMLAVLVKDEADSVVGSRYLDGSQVEGWDERRRLLSRLATRLSQRVLRQDLTDPMSGFFMLRREALEGTMRRLSAMGFKILLDILASAPEPLRVVELPYRFGRRQGGVSKMDGRVARDFLCLLLDKLFGRWLPVRFILFATVGGLGVLVHMAVLTVALHATGLEFITAQTAATLAAMTFNYLLNNELTYRDRRRRGWDLVTGWGSFALACSVGTVANIGVAAQIFANDGGWLLSALGGIVVGAVWNYATTSVYTWARPRAASD